MPFTFLGYALVTSATGPWRKTALVEAEGCYIFFSFPSRVMNRWLLQPAAFSGQVAAGSAQLAAVDAVHRNSSDRLHVAELKLRS